MRGGTQPIPNVLDAKIKGDRGGYTGGGVLYSTFIATIYSEVWIDIVCLMIVCFIVWQVAQRKTELEQAMGIKHP